MADRDKLVKVTLDIARMYRANDSDTVAITVGPGEVEVPAWVAEEWKPKPATVSTGANSVTLDEELAAARAQLAELERQYAEQQAKIRADAADKPAQATEATKPTGKKAH